MSVCVALLSSCILAVSCSSPESGVSSPRQTAPPFPTFEINTLAPEHVYPPLLMLEECNWVQALEGDIDSSHIDFVHAKLPHSTQRGTVHQILRISRHGGSVPSMIGPVQG